LSTFLSVEKHKKLKQIRRKKEEKLTSKMGLSNADQENEADLLKPLSGEETEVFAKEELSTSTAMSRYKKVIRCIKV